MLRCAVAGDPQVVSLLHFCGGYLLLQICESGQVLLHVLPCLNVSLNRRPVLSHSVIKGNVCCEINNSDAEW